MAKMSELRFARVNRDLCRILVYLTKFHDIGVEYVTKSLLVCWHIIKDVGCDKHPLPFARHAKQTNIH